MMVLPRTNAITHKSLIPGGHVARGNLSSEHGDQVPAAAKRLEGGGEAGYPLAGDGFAAGGGDASPMDGMKK